MAEDLKWSWISPGAILRESKEPWVVEKLKTAQLFDDDMVAGLVLSRLSNEPNAILDGFPRTLKQVEIMYNRGERVDIIVEMDVPLEEIQKRLLLRGRDQDSKEVIEERYEMYKQSRSEILAFLIGNGAKMITIDGVGDQDEVYQRVAKGIQEIISK